jgi:hypothetical protein
MLTTAPRSRREAVVEKHALGARHRQVVHLDAVDGIDQRDHLRVTVACTGSARLSGSREQHGITSSFEVVALPLTARSPRTPP